MSNVIRMVSDGLVNAATKLGLRSDKTTAGTYVYIPTSPVEIDAAYRTGWFRKIVDIPATDMVSEWRAWQAGPDEIEKLEKAEKALQIRGKVGLGLKLARLYGGAIGIMGIDGTGSADTPLDVDRVRADSLKFLHIAHMHEISPGQMQRNPLLPGYGEPVDYTISLSNGQMVRIHPSRVIRFIGNYNPQALDAIGWGDSVWDAVREKVRNLDTSEASIVAMMQEAKVDVFGIPGLMEKISTTEYENKLVRRFEIAQQMKSIVNAVIRDGGDGEGKGGEEWEQKQIDFSSLPDVLDRFMVLAAGIADIPVTRMFGTSAKGLNATGEGDDRNYLKSIGTKQELEVRPQLEKLDEVFIRSTLGSRPEEIFFVFNPLWEPTAKETAEIDKMNAETIDIIGRANIMPEQAFAVTAQQRLIEGGRWPGIEGALEEFGTEPDAPDPATIGLDPETGMPMPANGDEPQEGDDQQEKRFVGDARPMTLYVRRDVVNRADIVKWARSQGLVDIVPDLHVTIAHSTSPVDWMKVPAPWEARLELPAGGPRVVEPLGPKSVIVLHIRSHELEWRHHAIRDAGASWEWTEYQPHITIAAALPEGVSIEDIEPYRGKIALGPEIFEEVKTK